MTKIILSGIFGKMGQAVVAAVTDTDDLEIVAGYDPHATTTQTAENIPVYTQKEDLEKVKADVWLDFTTPQVVFENISFALKQKWTPVVGTTGLTAEQITTLTQLAQQQDLGGLIVPNFSISAVLMMEFSQKAAQYFPDVEIIELHHQHKKDAPSGTALRTADLISKARHSVPIDETQQSLPGARGARYRDISIHSVRLPGLVAHQQVQFGAAGEGLIIRQDSYDRISFMAGVILACQKVQNLTDLKIGLENIL